MKRRVLFRLAAGVTALAAFSLSCKLLDQASQVSRLATQAQAAVTELNVPALGTDMPGLATEIDLGGVATSMQGLATEIDMEAVATSMQGLATQIDIPGLLTAMPNIDIGGVMTDVVATPSGFPADIPLLASGLSDMRGTPTSLEYSADTTVKDAADFYRREMPAQGWTETPGGQVSGASASLSFQKGSRTARITIEEDFILGVVVKIALQ